MDLVKSTTGKVVTAALVLGVGAGGYAWFGMTADERGALAGALGRVALWVGVVLVLPFGTFFLSTGASRANSNAAGAALVAGYVCTAVLLMAALAGWHLPDGSIGWTAAVLGVLVAGVYDLLACDWIADKWG